MARNIKRNIPLLNTMQFLRWFLLTMPIVVIYFQEHGLSMVQVMVVQGVFSVSMLVFEIPSGYFSDKIGRKITLIIGMLLNAIGLTIFGLLLRFEGFILAYIFMGIGTSFLSGTDSSLLYDTLLVLKDEKNHHKREGFYMSIANYSESIASILGGIVAVYSMRYNYFIHAALILIAALLALFLVEPEIERQGYKALNFRSFLIDIKKIFRDKRTKYLVSFGALSGLGTFLALWYVQPEMLERGMLLGFFGFVWAGLNTSVGISSTLSHRLGKTSKPLDRLKIFPFFLAFAYFSLIFLKGLWILLGFLIFYIIRGVKNPLERTLIHQHIDSQNRATVLSIQSMLMRILFSVFAPLFAMLAVGEDNSRVYLVIGVIYLVWAFINLGVKKEYE